MNWLSNVHILSVSCISTDFVEEELVRLRGLGVAVFVGDIFDNRGQVVEDGARRCRPTESEDDECAVQHPPIW